MQIGGNGCIWVCMDALGRRGHGEHKNKAIRGHLGSRKPGFGIYGRGNFPGHDVLGGLTKSVKDGCRWAKIGVDGFSRAWGHGGKVKQHKNIYK